MGRIGLACDRSSILDSACFIHTRNARDDNNYVLGVCYK